MLNKRPTSPLTGNDASIEIIREIDVEQICREWRVKFDVEVSPIFGQHQKLQLCHCPESDVQFFYPSDCLGGDEFYAELQKFPWYYLAEKWEHLATKKMLPTRGKILEVGCGTGGFLKTVIDLGHEALGLEMNSEAIKSARERSLPVSNQSLGDIAEKHGEAFDVVCHFQVLEHIAEPIPFLGDCLRCLKPGGLLMVGVPNQDGFLGISKHDLLDQPPHHATKWSSHALQRLGNFLPMDLVYHECEPLASYHVSSWAYANTHHFFGWPNGIMRYAATALAIPVGWLIRLPFLRKQLIGHTQLAVFQKPRTSTESATLDSKGANIP